MSPGPLRGKQEGRIKVQGQYGGRLCGEGREQRLGDMPDHRASPTLSEGTGRTGGGHALTCCRRLSRASGASLSPSWLPGESRSPQHPAAQPWLGAAPGK